MRAGSYGGPVLARWRLAGLPASGRSPGTGRGQFIRDGRCHRTVRSPE